MNIFKDFSENLGKGLLSGAANFGLIQLLSPASGEQDIMGLKLKFAFPIVCVMSSFIADSTHDLILKNIPQSKKYATLESSLLNLGVSGGSSALLMKFADNENGITSLGRVAMIGASSDILGHYLYHNIIKPIL